MNHIFDLNGKPYLLRSETNRITLFSLPALIQIHKYYINHTFTIQNSQTLQILTIQNNTLTILKPALYPLQIIQQQQSFLEWQPKGGLILSNNIICYDGHSIIFYLRGKILDKAWQIDVIQQIQEIQVNGKETNIALKVKSPNNIIFVWKVEELNVKPNQQIMLNSSIIQWGFYGNNLLSILTPTQFRIYNRDNENNFYMIHFFEFFNFKKFCWLTSPPSQTPNNRESVSNIALLSKNGQCTFYELYNIDRRVVQSRYKQINKLTLRYKDISMKNIISAWQYQKNLYLLSQTKNSNLFLFNLDEKMKITKKWTNQELLGAHIDEVYCIGNIILAKDKTRWKYFQYISNSNFRFYGEIQTSKAFIGISQYMYYFMEGQFWVENVESKEIVKFDVKNANAENTHLIGITEHFIYYVVGIRFYKLDNINKTLTLSGFSLKSQKAKLQKVSIFTKTLYYQLNNQNLIMEYLIGNNNKPISKPVRSSTHTIVGLGKGRWGELDFKEIRIGQGDRVLVVFQMARIKKILEVDLSRSFQYDFHAIKNNGFILMVKNYVFFLQLVNDESGYHLQLLKNNQTILYKRFNPHLKHLKLLSAEDLTFRLDHTITKLGYKINNHITDDPYDLPDTLLRKQLELHKFYPPHHPKLINCLIQCNYVQLAVEVLKKIRCWLNQGGNLKSLAENIGYEFMGKFLAENSEISFSKLSRNVIQEDIEEMSLLSKQLTKKDLKIYLQKSDIQTLQTQLSSLQFFYNNSSSIDSFSQSSLILLKTAYYKQKPLQSMQIAFLSHSLNKQDAISFIKPQKFTWEWIKHNSAVLWYDNKEVIKKWIQEIALVQYRSSKEPMNCLLWYLLVGKKTLLINLFKNHKLDSKQHQAIYNFLQRDFTQLKQKTAANKNAYVLFDKKRFHHSLAFFLLAQRIDDCLRICIDRLKDFNLAFLISIMTKNQGFQYICEQMINKGDIWMKHLSYKLQGKHMLSYNALIGQDQVESWEYLPKLSGFHPAVVMFSEKIKSSTGVKREIEEQDMQKQTASTDIFDDFYGNTSTTTQKTSQSTPKIYLNEDSSQTATKSIQYYLRNSLPSLALILDKSNKQIKDSYDYQNYKLFGTSNQSIQKMIIDMQDVIGITRCFMDGQRYDQLIDYLQRYLRQFQRCFGRLYFVEIMPTRKIDVGELIHYCYFGDIVVGIIQDGKGNQNVGQIKDRLKNMVVVGKIYSSLQLEFYHHFPELLSLYEGKKTSHNSNEFYTSIKHQYNLKKQPKKQKLLKHMDHFEHAFIKIMKKDDQTQYRTDYTLILEQANLLIFRFIIFEYLCSIKSVLHEVNCKNREHLQYYTSRWIQQSHFEAIMGQYKTLVKEGPHVKLKLQIIPLLCQESFPLFHDIVVHTSKKHIQESRIGLDELIKEELGIEIFKNRQEGIKSFALNINSGRGLEIAVLMKRNFRKIQICESLTRRQRYRDGYMLASQDTFTNKPQPFDFRNIAKYKYGGHIDKTLKAIANYRKNQNSGGILRSSKTYNQKDYYKVLEPLPYINLNELYSMESHSFLPFLLIGGKSVIEVCGFEGMKNFNRVKCGGQGDIVKMFSEGHRVTALDTDGSLCMYNFDSKYVNNPVYSLKKAGIFDCCLLSSSVMGALSTSGFTIYDTLIHPNRQPIFKQSFSKQAITISTIDNNRISILRKSELLVYDIRNQRLEVTKDLKNKGKSMAIVGGDIYVGKMGMTVDVFSANSQKSYSIKLGIFEQKQKTEKVGVESIKSCGEVVICQTSQGSLFYAPKMKLQ